VAHPRTGELTEIQVTREAVSGILFAALYSDLESAMIPLAVEKAVQGDFSVIAAAAEGRSAMVDLISSGMQLAVLCNEDLSRIPDTAATSADAGADTDTDTDTPPPVFSASEFVHNFKRHCKHFPKANLPDSYFDPVVSDVPVLVLSGELDPVTPPRWGAETAEHLARALHLVVPGVGHGTTATSCVSGIVHDFIDRGSTAELDTRCVARLKRAALFLSNTGPIQAEKKDD